MGNQTTPLLLPAESSINQFLFIALCSLVGLLYIAGLPIYLMEPDAAVYAILSKNMVQSGNYWDLYLYDKDWLDKPHFPFWITAFSFLLFGVNTIAYKLPALLFILLAACYTYRFAKELYSTEVARLAVLILLTALHLVMSNSDVRAEPYLTGLVIASTYHLYRLQHKFTWGHLLWGALYAACAIMTKGIFTIVPIGGAIFIELLIKRQWKDMFHWKWLLVGIVTLLFTAPELYSLYHQFDMHPEKEIFGETHVSGIRFFFWDSQFGRFFNTGPIKGQGDKFFFLHTLLWAFLPWGLLMYYALIKQVKENIQRVQQEFYTIGGAFITILLFSLSQFQLPHYTNIIFPFLAIFTAKEIVIIGTTKKGELFYTSTQYFTIGVLLFAPVLLHYFFRPETISFWFVLAALSLIGIFVYLIRSTIHSWLKVFYYTCLSCLFFTFYLNLIFYPAVLHYQASSEAAFYTNKHYSNTNPVVFGDLRTLSFDFYAHQHVKWYFTLDEFKQVYSTKPMIVYTTMEKLQELKNANIPYQLVKEFKGVHVTTLTGEFINHETRSQSLETSVLVLIYR
ncbi:glycosyltransferase family 39 protein [Cytophagaceae bacterium DM2B3-1]|uniref:Glycosyltransferase family 39 protein n=1 Tax=Xanthocytophaga flava TaxID=3048013 RepID=A0ABT7CJS8_9BACT|nr:glycosyltransferase family 39 protein [Xanthocytophaga flavus]MDJ1493991.1 glycosyltransferase family 39 protein [Xanthocytophaga flavus]